MENKVTYNELSQTLLDRVKVFLPKKGQTVYFESIRPKARGTSVLPFDRIWDPHKNEGKGDFVDIAYLTGWTNPKPKEPSLPVFGKIQFTKDGFGRIAITGGNRDHENMFTFMFLTNQRTQNVGTPWYVNKQGSHGIFKLLEPKKSAIDQMEVERSIYSAMGAIDLLSGIKLREIALGMDLKGITEHSDEEEIRLELIKIAKKPDGRGAEKILNLENDERVKAKALIKHASRLQLIQRDDALRVWIWPDTLETICVIPEGTKGEDALVSFLVDNHIKGTAIYRHLKELVNNMKKTVEDERIPPAPEVKERPVADTVITSEPLKPKPGRPFGTTGIKKKVSS